jgi:hypothetical protein
MALPEPRPSLLIRYAYLWWDEAKAGSDAGRKDRPCMVVLTVSNDQGKAVVLVAPVTHRQPDAPSDGVEIPLSTKRRLGLDEKRSWIITTEVNQFEWPGPDLRPTERADPEDFAYGFIPAKLFDTVVSQIRANSKTVTERAVPRTR